MLFDFALNFESHWKYFFCLISMLIIGKFIYLRQKCVDFIVSNLFINDFVYDFQHSHSITYQLLKNRHSIIIIYPCNRTFFLFSFSFCFCLSLKHSKVTTNSNLFLWLKYIRFEIERTKEFSIQFYFFEPISINSVIVLQDQCDNGIEKWK